MKSTINQIFTGCSSWLLTSMLLGCTFTLYAADPTFVLNTDFEGIEKGGVALFSIQCVTDSPVNDLTVTPSLPQGFQTESTPTIPKEVPVGESTYQYVVRAPFYLFSWDPSVRSLPTGIKPAFRFNIAYTKDGQPRTIYVERKLTFTTHKGIYYAAGIIGIVIGFFVKSLLTWQALPTEAPRQLFHVFLWNHVSNFVVVLILGGLVLIAMQTTSPVLPASSFEAALVLGAGLGILGDETLLQKVQGKINV